MTPKQLKLKHPGYQAKISKSSQNDYELCMVYKTISTRANVKILNDVHIYMNNKYVGQWDYMHKPAKPVFAVWNANDTTFDFVNLSLTKDSIDNNGKWETVERQFDANDYTIYFLADHMQEFNSNYKKNSYKWTGMYDLCVQGKYPITHAACAQYSAFTYDLHNGWGANEIGLWHYKKGEILPPFSCSMFRSSGELEIRIGGFSSGNIIFIDDKEVKVGDVDISSVGKIIIRALFKD